MVVWRFAPTGRKSVSNRFLFRIVYHHCNIDHDDIFNSLAAEEILI